MSMPYRYYNQFQVRTLRGKDSGNGFLTIDKWTNDYLAVGEVAKIKNYSLGDNVWNQWRLMFRPVNAPDFQSFAGLDQIALIKTGVTVLPPYYNEGSITKFVIVNGIPSDANEWVTGSVTGKYYNGVSAWAAYPQAVDYCLVHSTIEHTIADLPVDCYKYEGAYNFGIGVFANQKQDNFWRNGLCFYYGSATPSEGGWAADDGFRTYLIPNNMMVKYFNAVCNSLSRYSMPAAGGVEVKLYGLGFSNSDAEIEEGGASKPGDWFDSVHVIYFEGREGQGDYTFYVDPHIEPDFVVDSNLQITIDGMPAMAEGTYEIKLRKLDSFHGTGKNIDSYAGDWRCDTDGRVYAGERIIFRVGDETEEDDDDIIIFSEWEWKNRDGSIFRYWAPVDVRTPSIFYDGRILNVGSFSRSPSDISGLAQVSDLTLEIANHDQEISKLLAEYTCLNCGVSFWWGFRNSPYAWRSYLHTFIVADFENPDATWKVTLRDTNAMYF